MIRTKKQDAISNYGETLYYIFERRFSKEIMGKWDIRKTKPQYLSIEYFLPDIFDRKLSSCGPKNVKSWSLHENSLKAQDFLKVFFSESAMCFLNLQISKKNIPKSYPELEI